VISISGRQGMITVCVWGTTIFVVPHTQTVIMVSEVRLTVPLAMPPNAQPSMPRLISAQVTGARASDPDR
jgi:hypothetical protein